MDKKRLNEILNDLIEVTGEKNLKVSNECLVEQACSFLRGEIANQNKSQQNKNNQPYKKFNTFYTIKQKETGFADKSNFKPSEKKEMATKAQLDFIYKNNLDVDTENLTKHEAYMIIKEFKSS